MGIKKRIGESRMTYRLIPYDQLKEGDMIQFFGVHVLRWEREIIHVQPDYAFVKDDKTDDAIEKCIDTFRWAKEQKGNSYQYAVEDCLALLNSLFEEDEDE